MNEYSIVREQNYTDLIEAVNLKIKHGWTPIGGVCATGWKDNFYFQALIRSKAAELN